MPIKSGFFNSVLGDRKYTAEDVGRIFDGIINEGVYMGHGDAFAVRPSSGNTVTVGTGRAWFNRIWVTNDEIMHVEMPPSDILGGRYDAVVLEIDKTSAVRASRIVVITGQAAQNPAYPVIVAQGEKQQRPLAFIYRAAGSSQITAADIRSWVGMGDTPFVTGIIQVLSIADIVSRWQSQWSSWFEGAKRDYETRYLQWQGSRQAAFESWFQGLQVLLEDDAAANLASQIQNFNSILNQLSVDRTLTNELTDSEGRNITDSNGLKIHTAVKFH